MRHIIHQLQRFFETHLPAIRSRLEWYVPASRAVIGQSTVKSIRFSISQVGQLSDLYLLRFWADAPSLTSTSETSLFRVEVTNESTRLQGRHIHQLKKEILKNPFLYMMNNQPNSAIHIRFLDDLPNEWYKRYDIVIVRIGGFQFKASER